VDAALWRYDILGSLAHAQMLAHQGIISTADLGRIRKGPPDRQAPRAGQIAPAHRA
jgi:argininosuccinate lyase